jgi:photosystem II stability/assembly factor-like uncharacterized protein
MADAARVQTSPRPAASAAAVTPPAPPTTPPARMEKAAGALAETVALAASAKREAALQQPEILVRSPDRLTQWRITAPGVVQRTADNGATWDAQPTGQTLPITAGSAPSTTVCWLVGRRGLVLLSADGRTWRRVEFPETVDLVAIAAADESTATITAAGGRTWTTRNGGRGWK